MASTRDKLITYLATHENDYVSGETISKFLNISRTAVWKQMKILEADGYQIQAIPNKGYRIINVPDKLSENTLTWGLNTKWLGKNLHFFDSIDSTQTKANQLAQNGCPHGTIVIADKQINGRGRMNRKWDSNNSNGIWMSIVLRPTILPKYAPQITILTGIILAELLQTKTKQAIKIKWPNDLFMEHKKVAGILTEMQAEHDQIHHIVLGIGLNVNQDIAQFDPIIQSQATSLKEQTKIHYSRLMLIQSFLQAFECYYQDFLDNGFSAFQKRWERLAYKMNQTVTFTTGNSRDKGIIKGINTDGALQILNASSQFITLYSAEIDWSVTHEE